MFWRKKNKVSKSEFKCSQCGEIHEDWPALTFISPTPFHNLSDNEKKTIGNLSSDFCTIEYEDQTNRFIRVVLNQKVNDHPESLQYGFWVSLSEKSYDDYYNNFENENHETKYFGWLSNYLVDYDNSESIPTTVITKKGNDRPEIIPHDDFDHQFVRDYYNGISKEEAERRIHNMMDNS
ncbi:DUF2199 domain-containing protein [Flavobacterium zhairuonense]|uniref:DUF2199 domain-containing protein n=1 Tax=Flavobacterium zhairuonense TaxID=2493631 RepID=UPI00104F6F25|nr:DUF2199 domain-containing protein [Flavobacterium zhairuonense]KAF2508465.1 DUF2199 domain-containing protein [Flavobacterium zhairuonense]